MDATDRFLLDQLKSGGYCGGDQLGAQLGISRVAVSKRIKNLRLAGVPIQSEAGKGYRLAEGVVLLDQQALLGSLSPQLAQRIHAIEIHLELDSTNRRAAELPQKTGSASLVLAEAQTSGRGRRNRGWVSTPWRNLMWSMGWRFSQWPADLPATSLLAGLVTTQALELLGVEGLQIKWPNDIYLQGKKLGGLLVSARGDASGECDLVIGIGINHAVDAQQGELIDQAWIDLQTAGYQLDRNRVAAMLAQGFLEYLPIFEREGFAPFVDDWNRRALYRGDQVRMFKQDAAADGAQSLDEQQLYTCLGADSDGSLLLQRDGETLRVRDADYSLRPSV